jgi:alginate O-acetyltransferase complex protein AlgI
VGVHGWGDLSIATHIVLNPATLGALAVGGVLALVTIDTRRLFDWLPRHIVTPAFAAADTLATILFLGFSLLSVAAGSYSPFLYFRF